MKATIRDQQTLRSVEPYQLAAYLHAQGWKEVERTEGLRAVWGLAQDGEKYELLVPLTHDLRDYALRMAEVLKTLETVEERSQPELLRAIETTSSDIIRIVAEGEDGGEFSEADKVRRATARQVIAEALERERACRATFWADHPRARYLSDKTEGAAWAFRTMAIVTCRDLIGHDWQDTEEADILMECAICHHKKLVD